MQWLTKSLSWPYQLLLYTDYCYDYGIGCYGGSIFNSNRISQFGNLPNSVHAILSRGLYFRILFNVLCGMTPRRSHDCLLFTGLVCRPNKEIHSRIRHCVLFQILHWSWCHSIRVLAPLIINRTAFKCYVTFGATQRDMRPSICLLFT